MWEPQPLTTLRASKACRGENFTFFFYLTLRHWRWRTYVPRNVVSPNYSVLLARGPTCSQSPLWGPQIQTFPPILAIIHVHNDAALTYSVLRHLITRYQSATKLGMCCSVSVIVPHRWLRRTAKTNYERRAILRRKEDRSALTILILSSGDTDLEADIFSLHSIRGWTLVIASSFIVSAYSALCSIDTSQKL
jgi:hypothetical protein